MSVVGIRAYTPEDLLQMPKGERYELVDGNLVERNMGFLSSYVGARLMRLMEARCQPDQQGWVLGPDCGYQCFPDDPSKVRKPDVSFIALARLSGNPLPGAFVRIAPDLAAEVLSPNDLDWETDQRVEDLLSVGVRLVWVINPQS